MNQTANTLVSIALAISCCLLVRSDAARAVETIDVVFLGRISPAIDPGYRNFTRALGTLPEPLRNRIRMKFIVALTAQTWRIDEAVEEAITARPTVIVAPSTATAAATRKRRLKTPVVFSSFMSPLHYGVISSTTKRDEPFAGVWITDDLDDKRLEILHDAYPGAKNVAVLLDKAWAEERNDAVKLNDLANRLGIKVTLLYADDYEAAQAILNKPESANFDAWCLAPTGLAFTHTKPILEKIRAWNRPVIVGNTQDVRDGAPLSYMVDDDFRWRVMTDLLARIVNGEPPGSIPVQRPQQPVLAVRAVPEAGFPPPAADVIRRADLVIR